MTAINPKKNATNADPLLLDVSNGQLTQHPDDKTPDGDGIKRQNRELAKESASHRALFEQATDAIVIIDESRKVVEANASFVSLLGYTLEETLQLYQWDWTCEYATREKLLAHWPEFPTTSTTFETRFIRKNGSKFDVEVRNTPDEFEQEKVLFLVCRDISGRKQLEASLRESEQRFHETLDASPDAIFLLEVLGDGQHFRNIEINPAFERMTGMLRSEIIGKTIDETSTEAVAQTVNTKYRHCVEFGRTYEEEAELDLPIGRLIFHSTMVPIRNADGRIHRIIGITRDITERKRIEEMLVAERNLLHTLIDNLPDNVFIKDLESRIVMDNIEHRRLLGVTDLDQIVGKTDFDFFPQKLAAQYFADEQHIVQSGEALINREEPVIDSSGNHRWLLTTKVPLRDQQGSITGIVGTSHDITERKQLEASLQESERRFQLASWATKDVIWERDLITNTILWNESVRKIFHFPVDEIEPTIDWWQDHIHPAERNKVTNSIRTALEQKLDFWSKEYRFRLFDGSYADIFDRGYIIYNEQTEPTKMVGAMIDITDKKLAEDILEKERADLQERTAELGAALRETEGLFSTVQAILKSANLTQVCQNLMEHFINLAKAERIALFLVDHVHQKILLNLTAGNFQGAVHMTYQELNAGIAGQVFKSGQPVLSVSPDDGLEPLETYERRLRGNTGSLIIVPLLTREGTGTLQVIGVVIVMNSIGQGAFSQHDKDLLMMMATQAATAVENIHLYEEAQKARDAADAANKSKSDFLANMSHEIRTPMNAILGLTKLVLDMDLDDTQRSYLQKVQVSSKALLGILNDILDYSKIEAGKLDLEEVDFDLDETIRNTIELFSAGAEEKGIELILELTPEIPQVLNGDPLRLGQVLNNLVGNALKFTERGEIHIKVGVNKYEKGKIWLQFSVRDTGIGMTDSQIERLFHAFNQADTSTTRKFGGTGLGLTISKRLVEMMGGEIGVESVQGNGSTFHFMVPLQAARSETPLQQTDQFRSMKTLVVDDQYVFLRIMGNLLSFWSFDVTLASSGEKGFEAVIKAAHSEQPFELILIDWKMPGMDGFELARRIRNSSIQMSHPPLIIMVTNGRREDVLRSADAVQIDALIDKPVTPSSLFDVIANLQAGTTAKPKTTFQPGKLDLLELAHPIRGAHILVVEDNLTNQLVAKGFLEKMALVVDLADDGQQAIDKISARDYDVVLMDLQMPNMDGLEATRRIRAMERGRDLPIIAMTAAVMQRDKDESDAAGMNGHIAKPINVDELVSVLMTWVPHHPNETGNSIHPEDRLAYPNNAPLESTPDFNLNITLSWLGGDQNLLKQILTSFQLDLVKINHEIRGAGEQGDWTAVKAIAHKLKGTAGNMGALALQRQAAELDAELMKQSTTNLSAMVQEIEQTSELCKRFITGLANHLVVDLSASRDEVEKILNELATILRHNRLIPAKLLEKVQAAQTWGVSKDLLERFGQETGLFQYRQALLTLELIRKERKLKQC